MKNTRYNTYNKREIMTKAWEFFRAKMGSFSTCLKVAWNNAKLIFKALINEKEECHTWYGWKLLGYEVIHESIAVAKVRVVDSKTKDKTRMLSYFGKSQVEPITE